VLLLPLRISYEPPKDQDRKKTETGASLTQAAKGKSHHQKKDKNIQQAGFPDGHPL
jgi:hypothetical protein